MRCMVSGLVSLQDPVSGNEDNLHGVILHLKLCRSQNAHTWLILVSPPVQCTSSKIFMPNPKIRSMTLSEGTSMGELLPWQPPSVWSLAVTLWLVIVYYLLCIMSLLSTSMHAYTKFYAYVHTHALTRTYTYKHTTHTCTHNIYLHARACIPAQPLWFWFGQHTLLLHCWKVSQLKHVQVRVSGHYWTRMGEMGGSQSAILCWWWWNSQ